MRNEDTNMPPVCTVCGAQDFDDCGHLVADIDITFSQCEGGELYEKFSDFTTVVETAFAGNCGQNFQTHLGFYEDFIGELWRIVQSEANGDPENIVDTTPIFFDLLAQLLCDAGAVEYPGPLVIDGGPGNSSSCRLFFSQNPQVTVREALNLLDAAVTKSRPGLSLAD